MIDIALPLLLLAVLPGYMMWRSLTGRTKRSEPRARRYVRSILVALPLDGLLVMDWLEGRRPADALGLAFPIPLAGMVGLGLAACLLIGLLVAGLSQRNSERPPDQAAMELFPTTRMELWLFVVFSAVIGCSWELLFRGYLLWVLQPRVGLLAAIVVASAAYGVAHGYRNLRIFVSSVASALIFTTAYAMTGSLWWLMIIHVGLPMLGAWAAHIQRSRAKT